jgi:hypothetical protein
MLVAKNIEDNVPFKGEEIVTPYFPQLVNITGMTKNYGKLINMNMGHKGTFGKRLMNVNDIFNLL